MGVLLSKPNTDKEYDEGENSVIAYAACSMQVQRMPATPAQQRECHLYKGLHEHCVIAQAIERANAVHASLRS